MAFNFGSLAGGLAQGAEAGVGMADKLRQLNDAARIRAARGALGRAYASDVPMTDGIAPLPPPVTPPSPGVASVPSSAAAGPVPDGGDPDTFGGPGMGAAPPPPTNDASGLGGGAPAPPSTLPPPLPQAPTPPPNMPVTGDGPATGTDGTALSGTAASTAQPGQDPHAAVTSSIQDANNTIKAIAAAVKQANPNIDPGTLFEAVSQHIGQMKGVRDEVKDYMEAQVRLAAQQNKVLTTGMNIQGRQGVADTRAQASTDVANTNAASRVQVGQGHDQARVTSAGLSADAHTAAAQIAAQGGITRSQIAADTGRYVADANNKTRVYDTQLQQFVKIATGNASDQARVDAASALANVGKAPPVRQRLNPLPMPAAPGSGTAPAAPPKNLLQEGTNTTFKNDQTWTLRAGVPTRVK